MITQIFYFSATGNSLALARNIAMELGETELISIPKINGNCVTVIAPRIGLVFPVYAWGLPRIVADFVKKLKLDKDQYIFAVATAGGTPCNTLMELRKLLRKGGADLNAGFVVKESNHSPMSEDEPLIKFVSNIAGKQPELSQKRLPEIINTIKSNQQHRLESSSTLANFFGSLLHKVAIVSFQKMDRDFWVNDQCNLCKTCVRICPRGNIKIADHKPTWNQNCELCFGCFQWCPQKAIQYQKDSVTMERSHHPQITTKDIVVRNEC